VPVCLVHDRFRYTMAATQIGISLQTITLRRCQGAKWT